VNNYPDIAKNALAESGRKDAVKTTLFFCLMNLRFGRMEAAKLWFREYFKTLDPQMLQQETAILLQSFLNGVFGKDKELEQSVTDLIDGWVGAISDNDQIANELLDAYESYISSMIVPAVFNYQSLLQFCENSPEIQQSYADVSKYVRLIDFVKSLDVDAEPQDYGNYKSRIDAILVNLISNYDAEELDLQNQQAYYRFLIENDGIAEKAQAQYDALQDLQGEHFNIGKQMMKWALYDESSQTDVQVRKFGFQNTKAWFKGAINHWDAGLHAAFPREYRLRIGAWDGVSNGQDEAEQAESMKNHFENNKFHDMYVNTPNIAAGIVLLASAGLAFVTLFALVATGLAAAFLAWRVLKAMKDYPARLRAALGDLGSCMAEIADFRRYYEENRRKKDELLSVVEFI
jgi:hypothetical protein